MRAALSGARLAAPPAARPRSNRVCQQLAQRLPARRVAAALSYGRVERTLQAAETRLEAWAAAAAATGVGATPTARRFSALLAGLLAVVQRFLRWMQLALVAAALQPAQAAAAAVQQQQQVAFANAAASSGRPAAPEPQQPAAQQQQQQKQSAEASSSTNVMGLLGAATMGAVEQLRHTLMDASQGIESKMSALEQTASSVQGQLFQAAQAHSEAVRSNPQVGMWKQPSIEAVLSEEERLREEVFAQVFAELSQKDNRSISFNAEGQP